MTAFYNEIDPGSAEWLRCLIEDGLIAPGIVDERDIQEIAPDELSDFTQCHFFAGIGGWSYALRIAGWSDDRPVWTGSCPCQPYSSLSIHNGGAKGQSDHRHLLPCFAGLIAKQKPATVFGEQISRAVKWGWLDEAFWLLEASGYACGAAILRADTFGAIHERERLFWVADASSERWRVEPRQESLSISIETQQPADGDTLAQARRALDGGFSDLLPGDGVSIGLERKALKGYGNAIVPQVAAEFIQAYMEAA